MPAKVKIKTELKIEQAQVFKVGGKVFKTKEAAEKHIIEVANVKERKLMRGKVVAALGFNTNNWDDYSYRHCNVPISVDSLIKKLPELAQLYLETNL